MSRLLLLVVLLVLAIWIALKVDLRDEPHTVVIIDEGDARIQRGALPGPLLQELRDVARLSVGVVGTVEFYGRGRNLEVEVEGLPPAMRANVLEAVEHYRSQIGA